MVTRLGDPRLRTDHAARVARGEDNAGLFAKVLRWLTFGYLASNRTVRHDDDADGNLCEMSVDDLQNAIAKHCDKITPK